MKRCGSCPALFADTDQPRALRRYESVSIRASTPPMDPGNSGPESSSEALRAFVRKIRGIALSYLRPPPERASPPLFGPVGEDDSGDGELFGLGDRSSPSGEASPIPAPPPSPSDLTPPAVFSFVEPRIDCGDFFFLIQEGRRVAEYFSLEQFQEHVAPRYPGWPTWLLAEVYWGCHVPVERFRAEDTESSED